MPVLSGRRALIQLLAQEGVELLFGNPGTTELPLMDALAGDETLRYVLGLQEAAKTALAPPTGPVFLSLPADILQDEAPLDLGAPTRIAPRLRGDPAAVEAAAALLARASRPVIIAGDAVAHSRAHGELAGLAEL